MYVFGLFPSQVQVITIFGAKSGYYNLHFLTIILQITNFPQTFSIPVRYWSIFIKHPSCQILRPIK